MRWICRISLLVGVLAAVISARATPVSTDPGSVLVLYTGFPTGSVQQYTRGGTAGPILGLSVLGDIPESLTVLNGQLYVGDGSGRVNLVSTVSGAGTPIFSTSNVGLVGLGDYQGNLLAVNNTPNKIYQYSTAGVALSTITLGSVPSGVNWSGITSDNSTIFLGAYNSGSIYEYSVTGSLLGSFDTHLGMGLVAGSYDFSNGSIWVTDANTGTVYDLTTSGVVLSSFATPGRSFGVAVVGPLSGTPEPSCGALVLCATAMTVPVLAWRRHRVARRERT